MVGCRHSGHYRASAIAANAWLNWSTVGVNYIPIDCFVEVATSSSTYRHDEASYKLASDHCRTHPCSSSTLLKQTFG